jgi:hypothetical protein
LAQVGDKASRPRRADGKAEILREQAAGGIRSAYSGHRACRMALAAWNHRGFAIATKIGYLALRVARLIVGVNHTSGYI